MPWLFCLIAVQNSYDIIEWQVYPYLLFFVSKELRDFKNDEGFSNSRLLHNVNVFNQFAIKGCITHHDKSRQLSLGQLVSFVCFNHLSSPLSRQRAPSIKHSYDHQDEFNRFHHSTSLAFIMSSDMAINGATA